MRWPYKASLGSNQFKGTDLSPENLEDVDKKQEADMEREKHISGSLG